MTNRLMDLATKQDLAVVTVNRVTVKPDRGGWGARLVPALGESYAHACSLASSSVGADVRTAYLYKSPRLAQGRAGTPSRRGTGRPRTETSAE